MYQRWYDQEPSVTKLMTQLRHMKHVEVQEFCGRMLSHFAEQIRKQIQYKNSAGLTTIGATNLQHLYKFKQYQRRWYDRVLPVQKAVGTIYTLPLEGLTALGYGMGDTFGLVEVYSQVCYDIGQPPLTTDLVTITKKSLEEGREVAVEFVRELVGDDLFDALFVE